MDEVSMTHNTSSSINSNGVKTEVLHMFDSIDGELNLSMNDSANSEISTRFTDIKNEMGSESAQTGKSVNLLNGNIHLKSEDKDNNNSPAKEIYEVAATDQNYNLTVIDNTNKDLTFAAGKIGSKKSLNSIHELNNTGMSDWAGINRNESSDNDLILKISSDDSDTDEVASDSSDGGETAEDLNGPQNESLLEESTVPVLENQEEAELLTDDMSIEAPHENSTTTESPSENNRTKKSKTAKLNTSQSTLLKFLVPRQPLMQESPGTHKANDDSPKIGHITISQLVIYTCMNCVNGFTTFGTSVKKCKNCGKRVQFNCFMCDKVYNNRSGIYSHVVQSHHFSAKLFNEKICSFVKRICLKCKSSFDSIHTFCLKCNLNLDFTCLLCDERCGTRNGIYLHIAQDHSEHFITASKKRDTIRRQSRQRHPEKSLLEDEENQDPKDASLIDKSTSDRNSAPKKRSSGKRKVRFQLDNAETDKEGEIKDISKSEAAMENLSPNPRYPGKRRSIGAKTDTSTETHSNSNKLSDPKQNVSNKRRSTNVNLDSSKRKPITEAMSNNEATTKSPIGPKQQITGKRRSSRISSNSSEAGSVSEAIDSVSGFFTKTSSSTPKISGRRSLPMQMQNSTKSDDVIPSKTKKQGESDRRKSTFAIMGGGKGNNNDNFVTTDSTVTISGPNQRTSNKRRSTVIAKEENTKRNGRNEGGIQFADGFKVSEISKSPSQQNSSRRRSSRISSSDSNPLSSQNEIHVVDVHPVPVKDELKQQITGRRQSRTTSSSSEATNHSEGTSVQQISRKRRSSTTASVNSETNRHLESSYTDVSAANKVSAAPKHSVMQGRRRSSRAMLDTSETDSHSERNSLDITAAPEISAASRQQITNKRRKSGNSISTESNSRNEISIDESINSGSSDVPVLMHCRYCQKMFIDRSSCKKHESFCGKEADVFCDLCSYATKYNANLKKHKLAMHGPSKTSETVKVKTPTANLFSGNVDYGVLYTTDSNCTDILSKMEAYCSNCKEDANMKPNDTNCRKCRSKLLLSCVKCCKVFGDFLSIFNHLYKECSAKQYHCVQCTFTTTSFDIIQTHVHSTHSDNVDISSSSSEQKKSGETPFVFAAQQKAAVMSEDVKMKLRSGFKTRAQNKVKPKEKMAVVAALESESKMKRCPRCHKKVSALVKHLMQCKADLRCPFCEFTTNNIYNLRKHLVSCHNTKKHTVKFQDLFADGIIANNKRRDIEEMMQSYCKSCDESREAQPYQFTCATCDTDLEYRCTKCQAKFMQREQLRKHVWNHAKSMASLSCTGCSKGFAFAENLRMHAKICTALVD